MGKALAMRLLSIVLVCLVCGCSSFNHYMSRDDIEFLDKHAEWFVTEGIGEYFETKDPYMLNDNGFYHPIQGIRTKDEGFLEDYSVGIGGVRCFVTSYSRIFCNEHVYEFWNITFDYERDKNIGRFLITKGKTLDGVRQIVWESELFKDRVVLSDGSVVTVPSDNPWTVFHLMPWLNPKAYKGTRLEGITRGKAYEMVGLEEPAPWYPRLF